MTIDEIYKFVQFMANKEQRGFVKPSEFNMLAKRAQLDVLKEKGGRVYLKNSPEFKEKYEIRFEKSVKDYERYLEDLRKLLMS